MARERHHEENGFDDEIDLRRLFEKLWSGKWLISGISFCFGVIGIVAAFLMPNIYRAEALLAPNQSDGASGLSALASQYSGIASLAGINLGDRKTNQTAVGLETLKSRQFITEFIKRHEILVPLIAAQGWNWKSDELNIDEDIFDSKTGSWVRNVDPPKQPEPSMQEAYSVFMERLFVSQNKETGLVTVAVEHYSPNVARQWVEWLVQDLNTTVMERDVTEAKQAIEFLNQQIAKTALADLQAVFFRLIEEQTKTVMLAEVTGEYLLKTLDPAVSPEKQIRPKRIRIIFICLLIGGFLGSAMQLIRVK